ncbi:MAG TPA: BON domain-containing protein [Ideonella sp.]|uniref:BON domain-containing protein n=1 Tax=Ideonella sp. TaxID=1929293 RepID=UPI002C38B897|nr:BON domain-containing protein [Ideonella sp.]HSI49598.1 BON domain-containing protein [Ideonella sp.]
MNARYILAAVISATAVLSTTGCAVGREQESVGAYIDDSALTARVKSAFASDPTVSAMSISVETMKGVVQLSGFAKSTAERSQADAIARGTGGVKAVRNDIVVRP